MLDPWFLRGHSRKAVLKRLYLPLVEIHTLRSARAVLFTCREEARLAVQSVGVPLASRVVAYGAADPKPESEAQIKAFLSAFPTLRDRSFLLFLGRIHPKKGLDVLFKAYARTRRQRPLPDLVIAGPDHVGLRARLEQEAQMLDIARAVHWTGFLSGEKKWGALRAAEGLILPSHQENFGVVVAEALACAKPVLLTNRVNIWREVEDAGAGLVSDDTEAGVLSLLQRFAGMSKMQSAAMAQNARRCFLAHFHIDRHVEEMANLIVDVQRTSAPPGRVPAKTG
jgi:glycosyltransferase involved in cell wall biosynthesis